MRAVLAALIAVGASYVLTATPSEARTVRLAAAATPAPTATFVPTPAPPSTPVATVGPLPLVALPSATPPPTAAPVAPPPSATPAPPTPVPQRHLDWGVYVPGFPGSASALDDAERSAGRHLDMVMWYVHWGGPWSAFNAGDVHTVIARGSTPVITWMSDDPTASSQSAYSLQGIAVGQHDAYIRAWADGLRGAGGRVVLRFDHEMNGNWYPWSPGQNGQTAAGYVAAWRHVHDVFVAEGATNVQWLWSPNVAFTGSAPLPPLYPGDAYVDRVGVDGFNWGSTDGAHTWQAFATIFDTTVSQVAAISHRPLMIGEVACTESGGDKAAWISDFFAALSHAGALTGFVWFDADKETDWRLDSSAAAQVAFVAGLRTVS